MPPYDYFTVASAGHPPPVLAHSDGTANFVDLHPGPPLGATADSTLSSSTFRLEPGAALLLYTDGLIERRNEVIDEGLGRLRAAMIAAPADEVCRTVISRLVGGSVPTDDIAMLAVRRRP
jgi:serine phosphatase RsbU (regulator of sigma subunit)